MFPSSPITAIRTAETGCGRDGDEYGGEGLTLSRVTGLNIGHAYTPEAIVQINEMMDALADKGASRSIRAKSVSPRGP